MKRNACLTAYLLVLLSASAFAQGLDLSLDTSLSASRLTSLSASASEAAVLSFTLPLGKSTRLIARAGATVSVDYDGDSSTTEISWPSSLGAIDAQELSLNFGAPLPDEGLDSFALSLGRIPYADPSGALFSYRLDGFSVRAVYPAVNIRAVFGFTGFLPEDAPIIESASDSAYGNDGFAPPRVVASFALRSPRIAGHEFYAIFLAQEDLRDESTLVPEYETVLDPFGGGPADGAYLAGGFSGPPAALIGYSAFGAWYFGRRLSYVEDASSETEYSYLYAPIRAFSFGGTLRVPLGSRITASARFQYGSGDEDASSAVDGNTAGDDTLFMPVTRSSSGLVFSPQAGNVSQIAITLTGRPFPSYSIGPRALTFVGKTFVFVKNGKGPISEAGVDSEAGLSLLGVEQDLTATLRLLSDLTMNLSVGAFAPIAAPAGAFDPSYVEGSPLQYSIRAGLSLAL